MVAEPMKKKKSIFKKMLWEYFWNFSRNTEDFKGEVTSEGILTGIVVFPLVLLIKTCELILHVITYPLKKYLNS